MTSATSNVVTNPTTKEKTSTLTIPASQPRSVHSGSPVGSTNPISIVPQQKSSHDKELINFIIQWTCGILATAAAIVFGIWAPLSYEATASGNHSNDAAQSAIVYALGSVADVAISATSIAKSAATAQSSALTEMQNRMALMGQLAVIDFCITHSTLAVCNSYNSNATTGLTSVVASLGSPTLSSIQTGTTSAVESTFTVNPEGSPHGRGKPSVGAVLGIVFGSIITAGATLAFLIARYRFRRRRNSRRQQIRQI